MNKTPVAILGATGMVGQRFVTLLANHPWFELVAVAASAHSAGKSYRDAVGERWCMDDAIPSWVADLPVCDVTADRAKLAQQARLVFSALNMDAADIRTIEEDYAAAGVVVVSNNSAHRWTEDVPMIIPEINAHHLAMIPWQQQRRGWSGAIVVKPNCSIQSYVPALTALQAWRPTQVIVSTYQAVSGAGKTLATWPEMVDNVIPFINGEEEKSEREPLKIWADFTGEALVMATQPVISANCVRVPVSDGHLTTVNVAFAKRPTREQILTAWEQYRSPIADLHLPLAPDRPVQYFTEDNRPQTKLDRDLNAGMGVSLGRLREDTVLHWKFVALAHNTLRGAAGGAVLLAELLYAKGFIR